MSLKFCMFPVCVLLVFCCSVFRRSPFHVSVSSVYHVCVCVMYVRGGGEEDKPVEQYGCQVPASSSHCVLLCSAADRQTDGS